MTREEEIRQYLKERNIPIKSLEANSIIEGIEWADENPKKGLVSIDKVCELLKKHINIHGFEDVKIKWIEQICKALEE